MPQVGPPGAVKSSVNPPGEASPPPVRGLLYPAHVYANPSTPTPRPLYAKTQRTVDPPCALASALRIRFARYCFLPLVGSTWCITGLKVIPRSFRTLLMYLKT